MDWLIYVLLTKVELYYIHNQRLKEVGVIRPRKSEKQLILSRSRANEILDEDCVRDQNRRNQYLVRI